MTKQWFLWAKWTGHGHISSVVSAETSELLKDVKKNKRPWPEKKPLPPLQQFIKVPNNFISNYIPKISDISETPAQNPQDSLPM